MGIKIAIAEIQKFNRVRISENLKKNKRIIILSDDFTGYEFLYNINQLATIPDIILIDIRLPVIDGVVISNFLKKQIPRIKIIAIVQDPDDINIPILYEIGVDSILYQNSNENLIYSVIESVFNNRHQLCIENKCEISSCSQDHVPIFLKNKNQWNLTKREQLFIILNATWLSYEQIANLMFVEIKTVHTYFDRVSKKLNLQSRQMLTLFAIQNRLTLIAIF